jgi:hypothetical protein
MKALRWIISTLNTIETILDNDKRWKELYNVSEKADYDEVRRFLPYDARTVIAHMVKKEREEAVEGYKQYGDDIKI